MIRPRLAALSALVLPLAVPLACGPAVAASKKDAAAAQAAPKYNLSKPVQAALAAAQDAYAKKDYATMQAKLAEADAALQTDDDKQITAKLHLQLAVAQNDAAAESKALGTLIALPGTPQEEKIHYLHAQAQLADQANDTATERQALQALTQLVPTDPTAWLMLGDLDNKDKNYPQALADTEKGYTLSQQSGKPVDPAIAHNLYAYAHNSHNSAAVAKYAPMMIGAQSSPANWTLVIDDTMAGSHLDEQALLDLYRLKAKVGAMDGGNDWFTYADLAARHGLPGEAVQALDTAKQKGVRVNPSDDASIRGSASGKIAADKASLAGAEAGARSAPTGQKALGLADGYLSYGNDAKAAEFYTLAIQKAGAGVNVQAAQTRLGIALAAQGQNDQAKAAFAKVTGPRQPLASLWSLAVDHPAAA